MTDRRHLNRILRQETIALQITLPQPPHQQERIIQVESIDVSSHGIQLHLFEALQEGQILDLCIEMRADDKLFLLTTEVRWCRQNKKGEFEAGIQILDAENTDYQHWITFMHLHNIHQ